MQLQFRHTKEASYCSCKY